MGAPLGAALPKDTTIVRFDAVAVGGPGAPGTPEEVRTSTLIGTLISLSARPATSVTAATRLIMPGVCVRAAEIATEDPLFAAVRPAALETASTWMSGCARGLVTYWLRSTLTVWPALMLTLTGSPEGNGASVTMTLSVAPAVAPTGATSRVPVPPGTAPLAAGSCTVEPRTVTTLTPVTGLTQVAV